MNHLTITEIKEFEQPQKIEMELADEIFDTVFKKLKQAFLIPLLRAETRKLRGDMTYLKFYLNAEEAQILKNAFLTAYTRSTGYNSEN